MTSLNIDIQIFVMYIIAHGDYCDFKHSYVVEVQDFTRDSHVLLNFIRPVSDTGGGDAPECYEYVLRQVKTDLERRYVVETVFHQAISCWL